MAFIEQNNNGVVFGVSSLISARHGFTTRFGGVSSGIYASLNLAVSVGDEKEAVRQNYARMGQALGINLDALVFSRQVHKDAVRPVTRADGHVLFTDVPYEADGLITNTPGVPLIIFTADCTPILLHDPVAGAVGAVHAGWRGTVANIAGKAVEKMTAEYGCNPGNIRAAIGPCISLCCFETGPEVAAAVRGLSSQLEEFLQPHGEKYQVDLKGINGRLLQNAGLMAEHIDISPECTMCRCDKYWSHRATHGKRGTQASVIQLDDFAGGKDTAH